MRAKPSTRRKTADYEVGWGKPPRATRWKPGQSGNPRGRPRGSKSLASIYNKIMQQKVEIQEHGKIVRISMWEAILRKLRQSALKGDFKAIAFLLAQEPEIAKKVEPPPKLGKNLTAEEAQAAYDRFRQMVR